MSRRGENQAPSPAKPETGAQDELPPRLLRVGHRQGVRSSFGRTSPTHPPPKTRLPGEARSALLSERPSRAPLPTPRPGASAAGGCLISALAARASRDSDSRGRSRGAGFARSWHTRVLAPRRKSPSPRKGRAGGQARGGCSGRGTVSPAMPGGNAERASAGRRRPPLPFARRRRRHAGLLAGGGGRCVRVGNLWRLLRAERRSVFCEGAEGPEVTRYGPVGCRARKRLATLLCCAKFRTGTLSGGGRETGLAGHSQAPTRKMPGGREFAGVLQVVVVGRPGIAPMQEVWRGAQLPAPSRAARVGRDPHPR